MESLHFIEPDSIVPTPRPIEGDRRDAAPVESRHEKSLDKERLEAQIHSLIANVEMAIAELSKHSSPDGNAKIRVYQNIRSDAVMMLGALNGNANVEQVSSALAGIASATADEDTKEKDDGNTQYVKEAAANFALTAQEVRDRLMSHPIMQELDGRYAELGRLFDTSSDLLKEAAAEDGYRDLQTAVQVASALYAGQESSEIKKILDRRAEELAGTGTPEEIQQRLDGIYAQAQKIERGVREGQGAERLAEAAQYFIGDAMDAHIEDTTQHLEQARKHLHKHGKKADIAAFNEHAIQLEALQADTSSRMKEQLGNFSGTLSQAQGPDIFTAFLKEVDSLREISQDYASRSGEHFAETQAMYKQMQHQVGKARGAVEDILLGHSQDFREASAASGIKQSHLKLAATEFSILKKDDKVENRWNAARDEACRDMGIKLSQHAQAYPR